MFLGGIMSTLSNANGQVISDIISAERSVIGNVLNIIRLIGSGLAIIMLTYMAISYFIADR